eukprot:CAMPEP_0170419786 /NCGR_PEP_ID=MMETSP0117_2-20130122/34989_1 /TAXON_ID=400756 /ORGANISM="Durinskia baltica, Strain CSIRO CS-38" /LENGTH=70 /DNA_ID=CAMNT_0010678169 /DNA_START=101 /DNA_END=313 /DNA_ORIENTATION=+
MPRPRSACTCMDKCGPSSPNAGRKYRETRARMGGPAPSSHSRSRLSRCSMNDSAWKCVHRAERTPSSRWP